MVVTRKHHEHYEELGSIVGTKYVTDDYATLLTYTRDVSVFPQGKPQGAVVRPGSTDEVVELVRLANQTRTPLIPMGGKASIAGVPPGQPGRGIIVDMRRMDKVIEIDEVNMAVTAQCGIILGELTGKVNEKGFDIHTAGQPHFIDTMGGHISGIPGGGFGFYGFSIGFNWHYILGMKVVLPDGSVVDTGSGEGSLNTYSGPTWGRGMNGPDITGLFIGDGGMFGIKVEATYRMFHLPKFKRAGARCWDDLDQAYKAYHELWEIDPFMYMQPYAAMMLLSPEFVDLLAPGAESGWTIIHLSLGNSEEEVDLKMHNTEAVCARYGGRIADPAVLSFSENFIPVVREMSKLNSMGEQPLFELILSRRDTLEAFKWSREWVFNALKERGFDPTEIPLICGLLSAGTGSGMTTVEPLLDRNNEKLTNAITEMLPEFLEQAMRRGYVPEATQSHQSRLKARQWTPAFYNYMLNLKKMMDPNNIMNPGVFFP